MLFAVDKHWDKIAAGFAINEGGGGRLDSSGKPLIMTVQAAEKFPQDYVLEVTNPGGHSSRPVKKNAINQLAAGLADAKSRLEELRRLTAMLGARLRVEEGEDVAAIAIRTVRSVGATYVFMGTPSERRGLARLGAGSERALLTRLLRGLPGVDVRIVADPKLRACAGESPPPFEDFAGAD